MNDPNEIDVARPTPVALNRIRDSARRIRPLRDPLVGPAETRRSSDLLTFGSGMPEQYRLFDGHTKPLRFAIKWHRATRLHTDVRLEAYGVLLSWASYQRPSLDPRKPMELREMGDHQLAYLESERRIPEGAYGAGPTIVWDRGRYRPLVPTGLSDEQAVVAGLQAGRLDLWIEGERLMGGFRLETGSKGWRLTKLDDEHATAAVMPWSDVSVVSHRSLDDIEAEYGAGLATAQGLPLSRSWQRNRPTLGGEHAKSDGSILG